MATTTKDALLTRDEVADRLRVSLRTVDTLRERGELKAVRVGRRVLVREADLAQFVRRLEE